MRFLLLLALLAWADIAPEPPPKGYHLCEDPRCHRHHVQVRKQWSGWRPWCRYEDDLPVSSPDFPPVVTSAAVAIGQCVSVMPPREVGRSVATRRELPTSRETCKKRTQRLHEWRFAKTTFEDF
jgi:hypothetical protein